MLTDRRRPGPTRSLSRDRVVAAGLEIMATDGLGAVSLRAVAQHLGVDHKTLYTYVSDKDDLLAGMFDAAATALDIPRQDDPREPLDQVVDLFASIRRLLMANMDLFHMTRPSNVVGREAAVSDRILEALSALIPDPDAGAELFANLTHLAVGSAMESVQAPDSARALLDLAQQVDPLAHPHFRPFATAWGRLDREESFRRLVRQVVELAVSTPAR